MNNDFSSRKKAWTPAPRPDWVTRINEEGSYMDIKSVVPLDENSLTGRAKANTGLDDFGDDNWYEPFQKLIKALDDEAELNLMGRLVVRSDILILLEQRLQIEETYKRHPEIDNEVIKKPMLIIGQGRSGTSVLINMLTHDPSNNSLLNWNTYFPCPPPEKETYRTDPRIEKADKLATQFYRIVPEIKSMHEFGAEIPMESIHIQALSFRSPAWFSGFAGQVASYNEYMQSQDATLGYAYEKRVLKLLQWKNPCRNWVFKSPYDILNMPDILKVYPDMCFVWTHRDPVKALSSMVNIVGTVFWARTDSPFSGGALEMCTSADISAHMLSGPIDWLESGVLPKERLCNVHYQDFVQNPVKTVEDIYSFFDIEMTKEGRQGMDKYMKDNPRTSRPVHKYDAGDKSQIALERKAYERYQNYFNVPSEV